MADISADAASWSSTAANNAPAGSTTIGTGLDDNLRAIQAGVKANSELLSSPAGTNTITASHATLTAYASGLKVCFVPANTNTGATTINISSLGAKNIYSAGAACVGGEIRQNVPCELVYDGTQFNIVGPFSGVASASGKTLSVSNSLTLAGTDGTTMTFPNTSATIARTDAANTFAGAQTFSTSITLSKGGVAGTGLGVAYNASNPVLGLNVSGTTGFGYLGCNASQVTGASDVQNYLINTNYATKSEHDTNNGVVRHYISSVAGTSGNPITWKEVFNYTNAAVTLKDGANTTASFATGSTGIAFSQYTSNGTLSVGGGVGTVSSSSDERLKIDDGTLAPSAADGMIDALLPKYYFWRDAEKMGAQRQLGFFAQNVNAACGDEAANPPPVGQWWGYYDRSVLAVAIAALQHQKAKTTALVTLLVSKGLLTQAEVDAL